MASKSSLSIFPIKPLDVMAFCVGVGVWFSLRLVGVVTAGELMIAAFLPFLLAQHGAPFWGKRMNQIVGVSVLYVIGIAFANLINGTQLHLAIRGLARPAFVGMITLFFAYVASQSPKSMFFFWCGSLLGAMKNLVTGNPLESLESNVFVYQLQPFLTSLCLVLAFLVYQRSRPFASAIFFLYGGVALLEGARSFALACFAASAAIFFIWFYKSRGHRTVRVTKGRLAVLAVAGIFGGCVLFYGYGYIVKQGWMGEQQLQKYKEQTSTVYGETPWGLLLAGRLDVMTFAKIVADNPLFGIGSWPDVSGYMISAARDLGMSLSESKMQKLGYAGGSRGAGHSIFLGAWGQHGIAGAIYWLFVLFAMVKVFFYFFRLDNRLTALFMYPFVFLAWAWMFSPWGTLERMLFGMFLGFYAVFSESRSGRPSLGSPAR